MEGKLVLVEQSNFFKFWNVAGKNEESDTSVNKNDENVTANQFYFPEFNNKSRNWYLPTCPLWSRLMTSIIKKKEGAIISKEIIVRNITEDINTNAQAEECFRVKEYGSFKEKEMSVFANLSKGITKITLFYKEKRWVHVYMKFQNVKNRLERSKINA